ncbi:MAG: LysM domain-containing protein [Patescibacteria group bacterium]|jgi:LysM repeat protein
MRRLSTAVVACLAVMVILSATTFGAEYIVKVGDNLTGIAKKTGHSVADLAALNEIRHADLIFPGQKISYVADKDLEYAKAWATKRQNELGPSDQNFSYFRLVIGDIETRAVRYSINQQNGTYAGIILCFAEAWRNVEKK